MQTRKIVILTISILLLCVGCGEDKCKEVPTDYETIKTENKELKDKVELMEKDTNIKDSKKCDVSFIRTYRIVNKLENYPSETTEFKYVLVDQYQNNIPLAIPIPTDKYNDLKVNKNYEITFKGGEYVEFKNEEDDDIFKLYTIDKITETTKTGMDQNQDSIQCK